MAEALQPMQRRVFGALALGGGLARIATAFLTDWSAQTLSFEALTLAIDFGLLFGLTGFYMAHAASLGGVGLVGYLVAASGIALIFGPDGTAFGVDIYQTGVLVIGSGLIVLSAAMLIGGVARSAAFFWLASAAASLAGNALGRAAEGFAVAGVLFGAGFVAAGLSLLRG